MSTLARRLAPCCNWDGLLIIFNISHLSGQNWSSWLPFLRPSRLRPSNSPVQALFVDLYFLFAPLTDLNDSHICNLAVPYIFRTLYLMFLGWRWYRCGAPWHSPARGSICFHLLYSSSACSWSWSFQTFQARHLATFQCLVHLVHTYSAECRWIDWSGVTRVPVARFKCSNSVACQYFCSSAICIPTRCLSSFLILSEGDHLKMTLT